MKKYILTVAAVLCTATFAFAQSKSLAEPNPSDTGSGSAAEALREVSIEKFERDGAWNVHISPDAGVISARLFEGSPAAKETLEEDKGKEDLDTHVLGVKVQFFRRGVNSIYITAVRPLAVEGTTKTISVWVAGRNQDHDIFVLVQDYFGHSYELYLGNLGFSGWKQMTLAVPPSPDGEHGIVQSSAYYGDRPGLRILGFRIDCNPMLAKGTYYIYFDDLRVVTDLFELQNRDEDDMPDNW